MLPKGLPLYHTEPQPDTSQLLLPFTLNLKTHANQLFWRRATIDVAGSSKFKVQSSKSKAVPIPDSRCQQ